MQIDPGIGIDDIKFGLSQTMLKDKLGEPSKIDKDSEGALLYQYNSLKCTFWFNEDARLHWIQCSNKEAALYGARVVGMKIAEALDLVDSKLGYPATVDDYGSMESYSFDRDELEVQAEYGEVSCICFGHLWDNENFPIYTNA